MTDVSYLRELLYGLCTEAGIEPNVTDPSSPLIESLKVFRSPDREDEHLHLINFSNESQSVTLPSAHESLPDRSRLGGRITLPPFGSLFLRKIA